MSPAALAQQVVRAALLGTTEEALRSTPYVAARLDMERAVLAQQAQQAVRAALLGTTEETLRSAA
jgi:hypothetical protein